VDLFNFVKQHVDIISVVGEYTTLKKTGSMYWKGRCPFHYENTPSFTVSPHKGIFYCFGCHVTGDVIGFVEKIENLNAFQAAQHLAQRYNLEIPQELSKSFTPTLSKTHAQLCAVVASWCNQMLAKSATACAYLKKRNISAATCSKYLIGFFPPGTRGISQLLNFVTPQGFSSQDLIDANIIFPGKQGLYSPYEDRIMFVIKDHLGHTSGFGGRIFLEHDTRPKYYNSKESEFFKKGKTLFGLDLAKSEIQKKQEVIVVEGYMDCVALSQLGYKNVVATLGTACSSDHLQQLAKHAQKIYFLYDADLAGKQAVIRLTSMCWQLDLDVKVVKFPAGQDPADFLHNTADIAPFIEQAQDIFDFFVSIKSDNFDQESMKHKMAVIHEMFELVAHVADDLKRNILLGKIAQSVQTPLEIIKKEYTKRYQQQTSKTQAETAKNVPDPGVHIPEKDELLTEQIIGVILNEPGLLTLKYETLLLASLSGTALSIIEKIVHYKKEHQAVQVQNLPEILSAQELATYQRVSFSIESSNLKQTLQTLMLKFQKKYWKSMTGHIRMKIMQAQRIHDIQEVQRLLDLFEELKIEFM
jgi:DNA primase